jgi:hypothetical protein
VLFPLQIKINKFGAIVEQDAVHFKLVIVAGAHDGSPETLASTARA